MEMIDSVTIIAAFFRDETHHKFAKPIFDKILSGALENAFITDYIIDEVVTFARKRKGKVASIEILDVLLTAPQFKIIKINDIYLDSAIRFFRQYDNISFTDATTIAVMLDKGIKNIYSFDSDFDNIPYIKRLEKPQNSYH